MKLVIYLENMFPGYSLLDMKLTWVYYLLLSNPCKFVSGYLSFRNNWKDI